MTTSRARLAHHVLTTSLGDGDEDELLAMDPSDAIREVRTQAGNEAADRRDDDSGVLRVR